MYLFASKKSSNYEEMLNEFRKSALRFRGRIVYSIINTDLKDSEHLLEYFGLKLYDTPVVRLTTIKNNMIKFKPGYKEITDEVISSFAQEFLDGKISHYLLTETLPRDWNSRNVKKLVGQNFNQTARNKRRSVLVLFCNYCLFTSSLLLFIYIYIIKFNI